MCIRDRCAGGVRQYSGDTWWIGVRRLVAANGPNIFKCFLLKCGKLATKYPWIYIRICSQCRAVVDLSANATALTHYTSTHRRSISFSLWTVDVVAVKAQVSQGKSLSPDIFFHSQFLHRTDYNKCYSKQLWIAICITSSPWRGVRSIAMSMSVCLSVCLLT